MARGLAARPDPKPARCLIGHRPAAAAAARVWGGAWAAFTWRSYLYYGDRRLLAECYEPMRRYVDFLESHCVNGILRPFGGVWHFLGDSLPRDANRREKYFSGASQRGL